MRTHLTQSFTISLTRSAISDYRGILVFKSVISNRKEEKRRKVQAFIALHVNLYMYKYVLQVHTIHTLEELSPTQSSDIAI